MGMREESGPGTVSSHGGRKRKGAEEISSSTNKKGGKGGRTVFALNF